MVVPILALSKFMAEPFFNCSFLNLSMFSCLSKWWFHWRTPRRVTTQASWEHKGQHGKKDENGKKGHGQQHRPHSPSAQERKAHVADVVEVAVVAEVMARVFVVAGEASVEEVARVIRVATVARMVASGKEHQLKMSYTDSLGINCSYIY